MKHFKKPDNTVWAFEADGSQDHLITPDMVLMSASAVEAHKNPPKTPEQLYENAKRARADAVEAITVTTVSGKVFDGDETSQTRMSRAIVAMQGTATPSTTWVLANNTPTTVTVAELIEALALAGAAQTALWVLP